jgi:hypothetical protein
MPGGAGAAGGGQPAVVPAGAPAGAAGAGAPDPAQNPELAQMMAAQAGRGRGGANMVDAGVYKVTLTVDGKEVATKKMMVVPDPLFK